MKLTTKSEYSLLALIYMARHEASGLIKAEDICAAYNMPKKYLEQLLFTLKENRYIKAKRGAGGGYQLAKPANQITIAEIIRLMDGALASTESVSLNFFSHTPLEKEKKIIKTLKEIRDYVANKLENLKLSQLV
ncbi:MAG: Rrf2 family transcriptional regulator [Candidatus Omnitrophica bacterium]|nr:Rrf2 family transcriptional regulator [Candidatus Omnitrophota bacterium]MDD5672001.1 Rrf2 family transcriptional regulator [Candidatus Omnitrophota bacterium]